MKKLLVILTMMAMMTACHKDNMNNQDNTTAPVKVTVNDFTISSEGWPEGTMANGAKDTPASYTGVKAMTLAFFDANGDQAYCTTQLRADNTTYTTFGEFELSLPLGSYTMVVLGYGSEQPITLNGATEAIYTADRVRETFVVSQAVNVTSTNPLTLNAELSRVVSKVIVRSTDTRTAGVDSVRVTFAAGGPRHLRGRRQGGEPADGAGVQQQRPVELRGYQQRGGCRFEHHQLPLPRQRPADDEPHGGDH